MTGLALLGLADLQPVRGLLRGTAIEVLDIPVDPAWQPLLAGLTADLAIDKPACSPGTARPQDHVSARRQGRLAGPVRGGRAA